MDAEVLSGLEQAVAAAPDNHALRLHLADLLLGDGQAAAALGHAQRVLASEAGHEAALATQGRAMAALGLGPDTHGTGPEPRRSPGAGRADVDADDGAPDDPRVDASDRPRMGVAADGGPDDGTPSVEDLYELVRPELTLDDVAGMEQVKERLRVSFLEPMRNTELREMYGSRLRGGLLLYGPPGCGKTHLARALAGELGLYFVTAGLSEVLDRWLGETEKNLHALFERARRAAPSVVFLDELDALGHRRSRMRGDSGMRSAVNQLLVELDGVEHDNDGLLVLGATNQPWDVDPALRRPGRFDRTVLVLPPDPPAREAIMAHALADLPVGEVDLAAVAVRTEGWSGADLVHLVGSAAEFAMSDAVRTGSPRPVGQHDLERALGELRGSTDAWFTSAEPFVEFGNEDGEYDELVGYLDQRAGRRRGLRFRR